MNGEILLRGGEAIQRELRDYLKSWGVSCVPPGTVVRTSAGRLPFQHILHAVAIDPVYDSSVELATTTLGAALAQARDLDARTLALPALATGYGPLSLEEFCLALKNVLDMDWSPLHAVTLVLRRGEDVARARAAIASNSTTSL